ncbi:MULTISPECIES: MgtC/SapB family protein [unclassified Thiocapsa]|uniref:MgtC/SapB family protein n=1 Tax=unclassified Thiocapsa TaxID=2641286 RepID=UPI0035B2711A
MLEGHHVFAELAVALAIGLLIGVERGWKDRSAEEGRRVAGVRTYALLGFLGGISGLVAGPSGGLTLGLIFVGLAGALTVAHVLDYRRDEDVGITSLVAGLMTFLLGALAVLGELAAAAAAAVVTALVLGYKPLIHRWIHAIEQKDLKASLTLLLISVVLLPILPDQGYGPWNAVNPREIWWMVVLIASISFVGYYAMKLVGTRRGILFTGLFGGLASSTALTLHFSRLARARTEMAPVLATAILVACATMFPRMLLVSTLIHPPLLPSLLWPAATMALIAYGFAAVFWLTQPRGGDGDADALLDNPLELKSAVGFGLLLALVMVSAKGLESWVGASGIMMLAAASGIADVDAITLTIARISRDELPLGIAVSSIVIAAAVNSLVKGIIAASVGGRALGLRVALPLLGAGLAGLAVAWWTLF